MPKKNFRTYTAWSVLALIVLVMTLTLSDSVAAASEVACVICQCQAWTAEIVPRISELKILGRYILNTWQLAKCREGHGTTNSAAHHSAERRASRACAEDADCNGWVISR